MFSTSADRPRTAPDARLALAMAAGIALAGCGAADPSREQQLDAGFRRIQRHEARIDAERGVLGDTAEGCATRQAAADTVCAEGAAVCAVARELADADAFARCDAAAGACRAAHAEAQRGCEP